MYGSPVLHHLLQEAIETVIDFFGNLLEQGFDAWRERRRTRRASAGHHVGIDPKSPDDIRKPLIEDAGPDLYFFGDSNASSEQLIRIARPFKPNYSQPTEFPRGIFIPGIDSSAIVVRGEVAGQQEIPMNLIELHWAYYALFMEMDRGLLATLDNDKWQTPESLPELEADAERIFRIYMRVREARARLDSALTDLGGGQLGLWNVIADVTKFEELVTSVEGKVEVLQRVAEHRVQQAAAARARKIGNILSGLTALTVVTVVIALVSYLLGGRTDRIGHVELRILTILAALLLVAALTREQQREIAQRLKRARLRSGRSSRPDSSDS
jgi:hypothetical protein